MNELQNSAIVRNALLGSLLVCNDTFPAIYYVHELAALTFLQVKNIETATTLRSMGIKAYYASAAGFEHQTLVSAGYSVDTLVAFQNAETRFDSGHLFLFRHRKLLFRSFLVALASICLGLILGEFQSGQISIMIFVACFPIIIAFLAHWRCVTSNGSTYPAKWGIGFVALFMIVSTLSGSFLFNVETARIMHMAGYHFVAGKLTYNVQAAIMIFPVCVPIILLFTSHYYSWSIRRLDPKLDSQSLDNPSQSSCSPRSVHSSYPHCWKVVFVTIFLICFIPILFKVTGIINSPYVVRQHQASMLKRTFKMKYFNISTRKFTCTQNHIFPQFYYSDLCRLFQLHNGFVYSTLQARIPSIPRNSIVDPVWLQIAPGWEIAPGHANDIKVCNDFPWQSSDLVFADGSSCETNVKEGQRETYWSSGEEYFPYGEFRC